MKKRKLLLSVALFVLMLFSMMTLTSAEWKTENGIRYYYSNGVKVKGGPKKIGKKMYLFKADGALITNALTKRNNKLYLSKDDGTLITTWDTYKNKRYFGTPSGYLKTGLQTYSKRLYYFDPETGKKVINCWQTVKGERYYFQKNGRAVKNKLYTVGKEKFYFNTKGQALHGLQRIGKDYYVFGKNTGKMLYGSVKYGKYYYYLNAKTGKAITNGWKTINQKKYYYDSMGRRQTGWLVLNGKKYYLDPAQKGAMVKGKQKINGKIYNFGTKGYVSYHSSGSIVVRVNTRKCVVTVYDNGVPVKAMRCSPGRAGHETPSGVYTVRDHLAWWVLDGPSYGQYCSHFLSEYLFHSVPMHVTSRNPYKVSASDFNALGTPASAGCVRLCVADAKWIYYNVPIGSTVVVGTSEPTPLGKPAGVKMPKHTMGADPTDDFKNPAGYDVAIKTK